MLFQILKRICSVSVNFFFIYATLTKKTQIPEHTLLIVGSDCSGNSVIKGINYQMNMFMEFNVFFLIELTLNRKKNPDIFHSSFYLYSLNYILFSLLYLKIILIEWVNINSFFFLSIFVWREFNLYFFSNHHIKFCFKC